MEGVPRGVRAAIAADCIGHVGHMNRVEMLSRFGGKDRRADGCRFPLIGGKWLMWLMMVHYSSKCHLGKCPGQ